MIHTQICSKELSFKGMGSKVFTLAMAAFFTSALSAESFAGPINFNPASLFRKKTNIKEFDSGLPLFRIETNGKKITKQDKIDATLFMVNHPKELNHSESLFYSEVNQSYPVKVRLRGQSSLKFPQKQYQIEFNFPQSSNAEEKPTQSKISLLGLPEDDTWIFHAPYVDESLMRNALTYSLARKLPDSKGGSWYAPRTHFAELFLDGNYRGVYTLTEKLGISKEKVNIRKMNFIVNGASRQEGKNGQWDDSFEQLMPDFFIKANPIEEGDIYFTTSSGVNLIIEYPSKKNLAALKDQNPSQFDRVLGYAKEKLDDFEDSLSPEHIQDENYGPLSKIDIQSFLNYITIQEITKNIDGYRRSVYLQVKNGKISAGPVWDFNLAFGNLWFWNQDKPEGWQHNRKYSIDTQNKEIFWFASLLKNRQFRKNFIQQYSKLRRAGEVLSTQSILSEIENNQAQIGHAQLRHFTRWNLLGSPLPTFWFTPPSWPLKYEGEIVKLKNWVQERLEWLDANIEDI